MTGSEIREQFLEYFERHGHTRVRSSPLLPANDPTLLFTNAGMNQFKDTFLGLEKRDYVRACSSQKCVRAGGKHNDLDEVGKTARHQTFFEMLGNFSFGDYFKEDAIKFAWDLLVNEFKLDPARMWFSVFEGDDQVGPDEDAERFWEQVGAPRERILRFGRKDNFWQMGETGPCGPCSEVHYYMGDDPSDAENCAANVNGPGDIITEVWNLVFMQYNRIPILSQGPNETINTSYELERLVAPSVDTGMGLERLSVILQGVKSNYETDLLKDIINFIAMRANQTYQANTQQGFAMRVIADHARTAAFAIADGILPGNEGRNYVLRKIMRRAIYHGRHNLYLEAPFLYEVAEYVCEQMHEAYPELEASRDFIKRMVRLEEERFNATLTIGLEKLFAFFSSYRQPRMKLVRDWAEQQGSHPEELRRIIRMFERSEPSQAVLFKEFAKLYDTFGTPPDLSRVTLDQQLENYFFKTWIENLEQDFVRSLPSGASSVIEEKFNEHFSNAIKEIQQTSVRKQSLVADNSTYWSLVEDDLIKSKFVGYKSIRVEDAQVRAIVKGTELVGSLAQGEQGDVVIDETPFYAEAGGQVGDTGRLIAPEAKIAVIDTVSPVRDLIVHKVKVEEGTLKVGDIVTAQVDVEKRDATRRNHTATHLVHAALREVLGGHVKQAGSVVAPNYLRFDFNHYQPMTDEEVKEVERLVNEQILRNVKVDTEVMPVEDAIRGGAMALFGEKYSGMMRVLTVPGFSKELCGGTHVRATGDIGVFKITSDESIASGVRRIRAVTGLDAYQRFREDEEIIEQVTSDLRTSRAELPAVIGKLQNELKKARREADELRMKIASGAAGAAASNGDDAREVAGVRVLAREASGLDAAGMRQLSDTLLARIKSGVVVLGRSTDGKASLIVRTSDDLTKKVPAGLIIKELAPIIGGRGGGKADMAEGGGPEAEKLGEALQASYGVIEKLLVS